MRAQWRVKQGGLWKGFLLGCAIGICCPNLPLPAQPLQTDPSTQIQQAWRNDLGPAARNLKVSAQDGLVRITGAVDNLLTHDAALRIASHTPGVTQVLDQIEIQPEVRPEATIREDVQRALQANANLRDLNPQVSVSQGTVTLSGETRSLGEKQLAQEVVKGVRGVGTIQNNLTPNPVVRPSDYELESDLRQALGADRALASDNLQVRVQNGQATLNGTVRSLAEKQRATQAVEKMGLRVDNSAVQVRPLGMQAGQVQPSPIPAAAGAHGPEYMEQRGSGRSLPSDADVEKQIRHTLCHDPLLCGDKVSVQVRNNQAVVSGQVKDIDHAAAVFSDAYIAGVSRVDMSGLTIERRPPEGFSPEMLAATHPEFITPVDYTYPNATPARVWSDEVIQEAVRSALVRDPRLVPYMITVNSDQGKVTLTGAVDNLTAKRLAGEEAAQIQGVQEVLNRLYVQPTGKPADQEVVDAAKAAFQRDPVLARANLQVAVQQGQAVLSGTTESDFERIHAEDVVAGLNGVVSVKDDIRVNPRS